LAAEAALLPVSRQNGGNAVSGNGEKPCPPTSPFSGLLRGDTRPGFLPPRTTRRLSERKDPLDFPVIAFLYI